MLHRETTLWYTGTAIVLAFFEQVLWIRIQIKSELSNFVNPHSEYGSGSIKVKIG